MHVASYLALFSFRPVASRMPTLLLLLIMSLPRLSSMLFSLSPSLSRSRELHYQSVTLYRQPRSYILSSFQDLKRGPHHPYFNLCNHSTLDIYPSSSSSSSSSSSKTKNCCSISHPYPLTLPSLYVKASKRLQVQCTNTTRLHSLARSPPQHLRFTLDR